MTATPKFPTNSFGRRQKGAVMSPTLIADRTGEQPQSPAPTATPTQSQPRGFLQRHPVLTYFALVVALSWGAILLLTGGLGPIGTTDPRFLFIAFTATVAPAIVGVLMTGLTAGGAGYRDLLARLLRWRVGVRWYAVALLTAPLLTVTAAVLLALALRSADVLPAILAKPDPLGLLLPGVVGGLLAGFCEELGWTGFAIPRLRLRHSVFATGLVVGVVWGAWHFPLFREVGSFSGVLPLVLLLVQLFAWLPAYRVLMVWLYDRTGSLLVVVLMHASLIANQLISAPAVTADATTLVWTLAWSAALWLVVAAVAAVTGGQFTRRALVARGAP
jgi:membrane protease YdiL (CAAX protease family)